MQAANGRSLLSLPLELLTSGVLVHLSIRDLLAVNVAFTSTPTHRTQIRELWKSYPYECVGGVSVTLNDVKWLRRVDVKPVGLVMLDSTQYSATEFVRYIASNFSTLRKLEIDVSTYVERNDLFILLAQGCPLLEDVYVGSVGVTDDGVLALVENCRHLHTLEIYNNDDITDDAVEAICAHCPHLKCIGLSHCDSLTDASLIAIADSYPHLEKITLFCENFCDDGLIYFADKCHELRLVAAGRGSVTSRGLTALWAANPNLIDVDISFNSCILDNDIIDLVQCCPLLQKLNIYNCHNVTDAAVVVVAEHCPQLRLLNINQCFSISDVSLIALGQHCHELKSINISGHDNISDVGIAALAAGCPLLQEFYANYTNITDAGVVALARGCRELRIMVMSACNSIGITAISAIAENCPLMSELCLHDCEHIDDACLYVIAQHCRNLTALDFDRTGKSVEALKAVDICC